MSVTLDCALLVLSFVAGKFEIKKITVLWDIAHQV
jgi:hypothetical protein